MAQQGRNDLKTLSGTTFPTNLNKLIQAVNQRLYNDDVLDSKFNLIDDEVKLTWWDKANNITTEDYLQDNNIVLLSGFAEVGDIGGGTSGAITFGGDFTSVTKINSTVGSDSASKVGFSFTDLGTTNYIVVLNIFAMGVEESDNNMKQWVLRSKSSSSFQIDIEETASDTQDYRYDILVLKS